ncbi:hypothetical protein D3C78_1177840 [compost metagenome]
MVYGRYFDVKGTANRQTYGLMFLQSFPTIIKNGGLRFQLAYYRHSGNNRDDINLNAYHYTVNASITKGKFSVTPGYDALSGNSTVSTEDRRFDPLYGTPHKFWGYMDYFYAGTGSPAQGLKNAYLKTKITGKYLAFGLDYHHFAVANQLTSTDQTKLGDEIDLTLNYNLNKFTSIDLGYSWMKATEAMAYAKGQLPAASPTSFDATPQWAYLSVTVKPEFIFSK